MNFGRSWKGNGVTQRYAYQEHNGRLYKRKQVRNSKGLWIFVGVVLVLIAAAVWAPAGGFSWLFRVTMA